MNPEIFVVLHQSLYSGNIGSTARAMGNMGVDRLILVDSQCSINADARRSAVGCQEILNQREEFSDWDEFYQSHGEGIRIGFTARSGKLRASQEAESLFSEIKKQPASSWPSPHLYMVFGREDSGLAAEDIEKLNYTSTINTFGKYTSLNLSQAVLLALYLVRREWPTEKKEAPIPVEKRIPGQGVFYPDKALKEWIEAAGFDLSAQRVNAYSILNDLILRNQPTAKELRILEVLLQQTIRKLREDSN